MRVDEVSSEYNRLCCRPYHPFKLEFKQYIPLWGDSTMSSYDHLEQKETREIKELFNQWKSSQSTASMQLGMKDLYDAQPVLFTMVRTVYVININKTSCCSCLMLLINLMVYCQNTILTVVPFSFLLNTIWLMCL